MLFRFVKTLKCPLGVCERKFKLWQEAKRKSIERAFGVLQIKFQCLKNPCRKHSLKDAEDMVMTCICLHNMMVECRIENDENEDSSFYQIVDDGSADSDPIESQVDTHFAGNAGQLPTAIANQIAEYRKTFVEYRRVVIEARWGHLHDKDEHFMLTKAICRHLNN